MLRRWTQSFALIGVSSFSSGCAAALPELIDRQHLPLDAIIQRIRCELESATSDAANQHAAFSDWQLNYTITLKANEVGGFGSSGNAFPLMLAPTVLMTLGVGAGYAQTANRTAIFKFDSDVKRSVVIRACENRGLHPFLSGRIGFKEWLTRAAEAASANGRDPNGLDELSSISHTFQFSVQTTGAASAAFQIAPSPPTTLINAAVSGERFDDHIVEVVFAKPVPAAPPKIVAIVVNELSRDQKQRRSKLQKKLKKDTQEIKSIKESIVDRKLQGFSDSVESSKLNEKIISLQESVNNYKNEIKDIEKSPEAKTVKRELVPAGSLPPLLNQNLNSSLIQLQLERLNTTLGRSLGRF